MDGLMHQTSRQTAAPASIMSLCVIHPTLASIPRFHDAFDANPCLRAADLFPSRGASVEDTRHLQ